MTTLHLRNHVSAALARTILAAVVAGLVLFGAAPSVHPQAEPAGRVTAIAAGAVHTCAVVDSSVQCWGGNTSGQLGDGTDEGRHEPVAVAGLSGVTGLSVGSANSCVITNTGTMSCWGSDEFGQLGRGTGGGDFNFSASPAEVGPLDGEAVGIAVGGIHVCALVADGAAKCWGYNNVGQLGIGMSTGFEPNSRPLDVVGLGSGAVFISAGGFTCALTEQARVTCWGSNGSGQLGSLTAETCELSTETRACSTTPLDVSGLDVNVAALAVGGSFACALTGEGSVWCWGANGAGQLGAEAGETCFTDSPCSSVPLQVEGLSNVTAIAAGRRHACALSDLGRVSCWGNNSSGQLGDGTEIDRPAPVDVAGLDEKVVIVTAGDQHTCVLTNANEVKCWGANDLGQLGDGTTEFRPTAAAAITFQPSGATQTPVADTSPIFLSLGDSVLAGSYITDPSEGAAQLFTNHLSQQVGEPVTLVNLARNFITAEEFVDDRRFWAQTATTGTQLETAVAVLADAQTQDRAVVAIAVLVGGNDFLSLRDPFTGGRCVAAPSDACVEPFEAALATYEGTIRRIVHELSEAKRPGTPLFLLNYYNPVDRGNESDLYLSLEAAMGSINGAILNQVEPNDAVLVDIHAAFASASGTLLRGVDPTEQGHAVIADELAKAYDSNPHVDESRGGSRLDLGWAWIFVGLFAAGSALLAAIFYLRRLRT